MGRRSPARGEHPISWTDNLLPASFRGVAFFWEDTGHTGGRRTAAFEYPYRDDPFTEDLGRRARIYRLTGYTLGPSYDADRDSLLRALEEEGPATLIHPYLGDVGQVQLLEPYRYQETQREGRIARFEMVFIEAGAAPSPVSRADTASTVLSRTDDTTAVLGSSFDDSYAIADQPNFVQAAAASIVSQISTAITLPAVPGTDLSDVAAALAPLAVPLNAAISAATLVAAVTGALSGRSDSIALVAPAPLDSFAVVETLSRLGAGGAQPADPSYGLAGVAGFGSDLPAVPPVTDARQVQAINQQALVDLTAGAAVIALARLYAQTTFASSADFEAARDQITGLIDDRMTAADAADDLELFGAWAQLYADVSDDLTARGKLAPAVAIYSMPDSLPAVVLAQRLLQDPSQAPDLVARNNAAHPLFMPVTGEYLQD